MSRQVSSGSKSWVSQYLILESVGTVQPRSKEAYTMALGDAYALATADAVDGTLLVGADDDFDDVEDDVVRFRDEPV